MDTPDLNWYRQRRVDAPLEVLLASPDWKPLVDLYAGWYATPISAATGVTSEELDETQRRHDRLLPMCVREWYRMFGRHEALEETNWDGELPFQFLGRRNKPPYSPKLLEVYEECEDVYQVGVHGRDIDIPDPPVYLQSAGADLVKDCHCDPDQLLDGVMIRCCDHFSTFMFGAAVRNTVIGEFDVFQPGVCSARWPDAYIFLRDHFGAKLIFDFLLGYSPAWAQDIAIVDTWGFATRTESRFDEIRAAAEKHGMPLE